MKKVSTQADFLRIFVPLSPSSSSQGKMEILIVQSTVSMKEGLALFKLAPSSLLMYASLTISHDYVNVKERSCRSVRKWRSENPLETLPQARDNRTHNSPITSSLTIWRDLVAWKFKEKDSWQFTTCSKSSEIQSSDWYAIRRPANKWFKSHLDRQNSVKGRIKTA